LFAEEGAAVALVDSDKAAVEAAAAGIEKAIPGARVSATTADLSVEAEAQKIADAAVARFGALHKLVNVAGVRVYVPLAEAHAKDWEFILGVNLLATAYCCKAALPALRQSGRGTIVNISSVYGVIGRAGMGQYDTTKAAVLGLTRARRRGGAGIRVNAVCPGGTIAVSPEHAASQGVSEADLRAGGKATTSSGAGRSRARSRCPSCSSRATSRPTSPAPR
jgi:NAD(P)-dependent dehydrogenase (short-subunit alcohol dehydrogenase family)